MSRGSISLVVPVFNEEANLAQLVDRCLAVAGRFGCAWELVLVDDGSVDRSAQMIDTLADRHPGKVRGVMLRRNYGQHAAVLAGLAEAGGDTIVTLDADLQNPPEEIGKLLARIDQGFDVVGGVRERRADNWFRRTASRVVNTMVRRLTGAEIRDYGCMLRAYDRAVVDAMLNSCERSTFIPVLAMSFARRPAEVQVAHAHRVGARSRYGFWKLVNLHFDLLTCSTTHPLRLLSLGGATCALSGFALGFLLLVGRVAYGAEWAANGTFTLMAVLFVFAGIQLMGMGLLGEYIGRIYEDVRARPRYVVERIAGGHTCLSGSPTSTVLPAARSARQARATG